MVWLATAYDVISRSLRKPVYNFVGIAFEACKKFVNKEKTSFGTGDVDDNVLETTMLYSEKTLHW